MNKLIIIAILFLSLCGVYYYVNVCQEKNDLGLVVSDVLCDTAAVYTSNKVKGAPITVTKANLEKSGKKSKAVIVNSKNANTCNADGVEKAEMMCKLAADALVANGYEVKVLDLANNLAETKEREVLAKVKI
mgnify:CR=1 FL=1